MIVSSRTGTPCIIRLTFSYLLSKLICKIQNKARVAFFAYNISKPLYKVHFALLWRRDLSYYTYSILFYKDDKLSLSEMDQSSKTSFPICMRFMHEGLRSEHHLKYFSRMQYGLFIKAAGLTLEEAVQVWQPFYLISPKKYVCFLKL